MARLSQAEVGQEPSAALLCELCRDFFRWGWNMGTGGGASLQAPGTSLVYLTPSGVHKERMRPEDLFVYDLAAGEYVYVPEGKRPSASAVIFLFLHGRHGAGAVIHTHSLHANLATRGAGQAWSVEGQEYTKGIPSYSTGVMLQNTSVLKVPIIANAATEDLLLPAVERTVVDHPDAVCILVANHGAYHFGRDIWKCKAQTECLEYLFELHWKISHA